MKRYQKKLLLPLLSIALLVGCSILSKNQRTVYNTLGSVEQTATAIVQGYYVAAAKGFADTNGVPKVASAYTKFQGVMQVAVMIAQNNTNALAPDNVLQELATVTSTVATFSTKTVVTP